MEKVLSVSELNNVVKMYLKSLQPDGVWVKGEVLGFKSSGKYASFILCEKEDSSDNILSQVQVMCWGHDLKGIEYKLRSIDRTISLKTGIYVQLKCQFDLWPNAGRFQLIAKDIEPAVTLGEIHLLRSKIYNELKELGLHDKNKQLQVCSCPLKIALIASRESAGFNDFISEIKSSQHPFSIDFYHTAVQGQMVEREVVEAIRIITKKGNNYDVVVIVRGGGAVTDLKWFDNKNIGIAIGECPIPVLTGIGHEINLSLTDMVSNMNFKTPTAVAGFLVNTVSQYEDSLNRLIDGIRSESGRFLEEKRANLYDVIKDINLESKFYIESEKREISVLSDNLADSLSVFLKGKRESLKNLEEKIYIFDPVNTLKLGYSIARNSDGKIIKNIADIGIGSRMKVQLKDGNIYGDVVNKEEKDGSEEIKL